VGEEAEDCDCYVWRIRVHTFRGRGGSTGDDAAVSGLNSKGKNSAPLVPKPEKAFLSKAQVDQFCT
jgi:hypothetical protein